VSFGIALVAELQRLESTEMRLKTAALSIAAFAQQLPVIPKAAYFEFDELGLLRPLWRHPHAAAN
jgi:hypothetical protein